MEALIPRAVAPQAQAILDFSPVLTLDGARQVGKSTLAQMLSHSRESLALTLDDPGTLAAARHDPRGFVEQAGERTLIIDEVQRMPELTVAVKASVDRDRRPGRFILTGSSDLSRLRGHKNSLAGRAMSLRLFPLGQAEIDGVEAPRTFIDGVEAPRTFADRVLAASSENRLPDGMPIINRAALIERIVRGGYPAIRQASPRLHGRWLDDYVNRLLRVDAGDDGSRTDPARLESLLRLIAANQSGELVKARLAQEASLPASSVTTYVDVLSRLYLIDTLRPWEPNLTTRETGRPKVMVSDSGLAARLMGQTAGSLSDMVAGSTMLGSLLEGFVAAELRAQQEWSETSYRLFHWRDRNGKEVDLIIELDDGGIVAVEVTSTRSLQGRHFAGLDFLKDRLGPRLRAGVVLAPLDEPLRYADRLWGLPVSALWQ